MSNGEFRKKSIEDAKELQIRAEHAVFFEARKADPSRGILPVTIRDLVISHITEILGVDQHGCYIGRDLFRWVQTGKDPNTGKFIGEMVPCNNLPTFFDEIVVNKLPYPKNNFIAPEWARKIIKEVA